MSPRRAELDSFDIVEGLVIKGGPQVEVLNAVSLHGGLVASWPVASVTAKTVRSLITHWRAFGLPRYAQFDNDMIFHGARLPGQFGADHSAVPEPESGTRVRVPPEFGFQSAIENYNGSWQAKVWSRFEHGYLPELREHSQRYVTAPRRHRADRIESAPATWLPERWRLNLRSRPRGRIIYLRRTSAVGTVEVLGRSFEVDKHWPNRLVRVEVDLDGNKLRIYRLRRREPQGQPLLRELSHRIKKKKFSE